MNVQGVLLAIGLIQGVMDEYKERLEANGKVEKNEIDDIFKAAVIKAVPGGSILVTVVDGIKDMLDE